MLVAVPLENQLNDPSSTGLVDTNSRNNCVPTTLAAAGKALVGWRYSGGDLTAAVYGEAYKGPTDPLRYSAFLAQHGLAIREVRQSSGAALVATAKAELAKGHPVYGAIPSAWGTTSAADIAAHGGPTHAVMLCDSSGGYLTAMNPWPVDGRNAFYQRMSESWWASRLVYSHVLPIERTGAAPAVSTSSSTITPSKPAAGILRYSAHAGIPQIDLDGAQASYAEVSRKGLYPLLPRAYDHATGDSLVYWSDGLRTRAIKAQSWKVVLEDAGPILAAALAHASTPPPAPPAPVVPAKPTVDVPGVRALLTQALAKLPA